MNKRRYKYLFGPVPSRRFGLSLGVDLTPGKTCTMDCSFCQIGRTPRRTSLRREYVPVREVTREIRDWLDAGGTADYITISGSGEPTLHSRFGEVIDFIHRSTSIPVLLLTNSSLLHLPEVRASAAKADVVKVSLSAWDQASFEKLNHPDAAISFEACLDGLRTFRSEYHGELVLEVFLVRGVNSSSAAVGKIARLAASVRPDRIQLNTVVRPPAEESARAVTARRMKQLAALFRPQAETLKPPRSRSEATTAITDDAVLSLLRRHPCTIRDMAQLFHADERFVRSRVGALVRAGRAGVRKRGAAIHYTA